MEGKNKKKIAIAVIAVIAILIIILLLIKVCSVKEYKITFDSNGGSEVSSAIVKENNKIPKPADPAKDGYIFVGWYYNDELFDFETPVKQDMILKAEWEEEGNAEIEGVELNATELSLAPDATAILEAKILPENARHTKLIWTSSDENIVTVDENGNIQAVNEGEATITVTTEDGGYTATCTITVTKNNIEVTGVTISGANEVKVGSTIKLTAKVMPEDATNKQVTWSSSNRNIATVDNNGNVRGIKEGKVTITVTTVDGRKTSTYTVNVKANTNTQQNSSTNQNTQPNQSQTQPNQEPSNIPVTEVNLTGASEVNVRSSITLTASIQPSNATNKNLTWSSSNPSVASVNNGVVTGISEGETIITVTTADGGYSATHKVTVNSVYVITFTDITDDESRKFGLIFYSIAVTKDGTNFSGYNSITYNGIKKAFNQSQPVDGELINKSVGDAIIDIGSKKVTATVKYN